MGIRSFEIDTSILAQNIDGLEEELSAMKADFSELIDGVNSLDAMWEGQAHTAFRQQFAVDCETYELFCKAAEEYIECLKYACSEYNDCESRVRAAVDAARV